MRFLLGIGFLFLCFSPNANATSSLRYHKQVEFHRKIQEKLSLDPKFESSSTPKAEGRVYYPIRYGADPTGAQDSSDAIQKAVGDAFQVQKGLQMLSGINDLGGVVIDFQGGNYKLSKPISFPPRSGNVVVQGGTLRASATFPEDRYLFELSPQPSSSSLPINNHSISKSLDTNLQNADNIQYEDITFPDILFDSASRGGGLFVSNSARIRVTNCYFLHFSTQGILVQGGHETYVSTTFLGQKETVGGDPQERQFSGTAIDLASNDNAITDVAIFSAAVGITLRGQANMITGVHCYNKATAFGGVGILVKLAGLSQTRIDNCYLDYTSIVMEDPVQVHVTNGFFLGDGNVRIKSINGRISGLTIVNNMFSGDPKIMKPIVELEGEFKEIDQVFVDHNNAMGMGIKSTMGRLSVDGKNTSKWVADFSGVLLFPERIAHLQYSFYSKGGGFGGNNNGGFPVHAITNVSSNVVMVESDKVVDGVVSVVVDQYNAVGEGIV